MANSLYQSAKQAFLGAEVDMSSDNIKAMLIDVDNYEVDLDSDTYLSDIPVAARVDAVSLTSKTIDGGVFDAADPVFINLSDAPTIEAMVIYAHEDIEEDSLLIAYLDEGAGMPIPAGVTSLTVAWDDGEDKIFRI